MHGQKSFTIFVLEILLKYQVTNWWLKNLLMWSNKEADFFPEINKSFTFPGMGRNYIVLPHFTLLHRNCNRGPARFHRLTPNKRFEPVFSTVIMAECSLFNRMLLLADLIPVHLLHCGRTVMIGCNHTSFEWIRAVRHIYGIIRNMQGLYVILHYGVAWKLNSF